MGRWNKEGKLTYQETIVDGLAYAPAVFIGLFHGENLGKQLVRVPISRNPDKIKRTAAASELSTIP